MFVIQPYYTQDGKVPFGQWHDALRNRLAKTAIARRLYRLEQGHFGDCKPCHDGVWELRISMGTGYRVYYARAGNEIILLLCGGDKATQQADIERACTYWRDWQARYI